MANDWTTITACSDRGRVWVRLKAIRSVVNSYRVPSNDKPAKERSIRSGCVSELMQGRPGKQLRNHITPIVFKRYLGGSGHQN